MIRRQLKRANTLLAPGKLRFDPEWLVLGVNNLCNLHCKMCDVGTGYEQSNFFKHLTGARPLNMPLELLKSVMDQAKASFPAVRLGYAFTEPSIYPHLAESLSYASALGLRTSMTTNGLNLVQKAPELVEAGLGEIFISLDGPPAVHNEIRGHKRSFEKAFSGIEALRRLAPRGALKISVFCTITEWNVAHLLEFARLFKGVGVAHMGFMHTNFTPHSVVAEHNRHYGATYPATESNMEGTHIDAVDLDVLEQQIRALRAEALPFTVAFSPPLEGKAALETFYRHPEIKVGKRCNDVSRNLMIKSNGDVIPAHGRCYDVVAGNLHTTPLAELWNAPALAELRRTLNQAGGLLPACARCCSAF